MLHYSVLTDEEGVIPVDWGCSGSSIEGGERDANVVSFWIGKKYFFENYNMHWRAFEHGA